MNTRLLVLCTACSLSACSFGYGWSVSEWWDTLLGRYHEDVESHKYPFANPQEVRIDGQIGSILIKTWQHEALMVEVVKKGSDAYIADTTVQASISNGIARFTTHTPAHAEPISVDYTLIIPAQTPFLSIKSKQGPVTIKNGSGKIELITEDGSIDIRDSSASIVAQAQGSIFIVQHELAPHGSLFLKARDAITLALPGHCNAHLSVRTLTGSILSSLYITFDPITTTLAEDTWDRLKRFVQGTLGAGGASITLETQTGIIDIREL